VACSICLLLLLHALGPDVADQLRRGAADHGALGRAIAAAPAGAAAEDRAQAGADAGALRRAALGRDMSAQPAAASATMAAPI
jgi:hypothetical protein